MCFSLFRFVNEFPFSTSHKVRNANRRQKTAQQIAAQIWVNNGLTSRKHCGKCLGLGCFNPNNRWLARSRHHQYLFGPIHRHEGTTALWQPHLFADRKRARTNHPWQIATPQPQLKQANGCFAIKHLGRSNDRPTDHQIALERPESINARERDDQFVVSDLRGNRHNGSNITSLLRNRLPSRRGCLRWSRDQPTNARDPGTHQLTSVLLV